MRARELAIILAHVDPDIEIHISSSGYGCCHIGSVERQIAQPRRSRGALPADPATSPRLTIRGRVLWFDAEPDYRVEGPFLRKVDMLRELDGLS